MSGPRHSANVRTALILGAIALMFFIAAILRKAVFVG